MHYTTSIAFFSIDGLSTICFQSNSYLGDNPEREGLRPPLCDLCDEKPEAGFTCSQCQHSVCPACQRLHDKLCLCQPDTGAVLPPLGPIQISPPLSSRHTVRHQAEVVKTALRRLADRDRQVDRERKGLEQDIHERCATLLRLSEEVRDASLASLRDAAQAVKDRLQAEESLARQARGRLGKLSADSDAAGSSPLAPGPQAWPLPRGDEDVPPLKARGPAGSDSNSPALRWLGTGHGNVASVEKSLRSFIGTVGDASRPSPGPTSGGDDGGADGGAAAETRSPQLSSEVDKAGDELPSVLTENADAIADLKKALDGLVDRINITDAKLSSNISIQTDVSALRRELTALKDKNCTVCQDLEAVKADNSRLHQDVTAMAKVADDVTTALQVENVGIKADMTSARNDVITVVDDVTTLQGENAGLMADMVSARNDVARVKAEMTSVRRDVVRIKERMTSAKNDVAKVKADMTSTRNDVAKVVDDVTALQGENAGLKADITSARNDVTTVIAEMTSASSDVGKVQADMTSTRSDVAKVADDVTAVQGENVGFKADMTSARNAMAKVKADIRSTRSDVANFNADMTSARSDVAKVAGDVTALQGENVGLKADMTSARSDATSLQQAVKDNSTKVGGLEAKMGEIQGCFSF